MSRLKMSREDLAHLRAKLAEIVAANKLQRELTRWLGQVKCWGSHGAGSRAAAGKSCPNCKACR